MISNPGPNGWCTAQCNGLQSQCPTTSLAGRTFNCYVLQGATAGQCYVDCNQVGDTCPPNTLCTQTTGATGASIFLCMPCPSGMCF